MLLIIDHYDSFTYNLLQYFGELGADPLLVEHDQISLAEIEALQPQAICLSPGPGNPSETIITQELLASYTTHSSKFASIPLLGVCLGHQAIGAAFGAQVIKTFSPMHGKSSPIFHQEDPLFRGIPSPFEATRYHSLLLAPESIVPPLKIIATTASGEVMALRHEKLPLWGMQFHPESILTHYGKNLLHNFLQLLEKNRS